VYLSSISLTSHDDKENQQRTVTKVQFWFQPVKKARVWFCFNNLPSTTVKTPV